MKESMGSRIARLRKEHGMTQLQLAEKMGVTDKAVSKWERDLSCPDVGSLPQLAQLLEVSVDELMQNKTAPQKESRQIVSLVLKAVALAMGVAVAVLSSLGRVETESALAMLGLGLAAAALCLLQEQK